jgi:alkylhydroperoxidase family enzyme
MTIIQTVSHEAAEGEIKEMYDMMMENVGMIPAPMELASASPGMFNMLKQSITYYTQHPNLGFGLLSAIRYLVSKQYDYVFCTHFNKGFLEKQGMSEDDIERMAEDPFQAPLEDKERAMLDFVMKAIKTPDAVAQEDMDRLHELGWSDGDILDALAHGTNMVGFSILMKTFKSDRAC